MPKVLLKSKRRGVQKVMATSTKSGVVKSKADDLDDDDEYDFDSTSTKKLSRKEEENAEIVNRLQATLDHFERKRACSNPEDLDPTYEFYLATLADTIEMIPLARKRFMQFQNQSNAYTYNGLITKAQELIADLEALGDKSTILERILTQLITPSFSAITSNVGNAYVMLTGDIKAVGLSPEQEQKVLKIIATTVRSIGSHIQDTANGVATEIRGQFDG